jgi:hypothetical protein
MFVLHQENAGRNHNLNVSKQRSASKHSSTCPYICSLYNLLNVLVALRAVFCLSVVSYFVRYCTFLFAVSYCSATAEGEPPIFSSIT